MVETKPATSTATKPITPQTTTPDPTKPGTATPATGTTGTPATATATPPAKPAEPMYPSVEDIMFVCPTAKKENVVKNLPGLVEEMAKAGLSSKNNLVGIIATIHVETEIDPFNPIEEIDGANQALINGYKGGSGYFGRGYIQITHDYNYKAAGNAIGLGDQLVNDPKIALRPEIASKVTTWYWKTNGVDKASDAGDWRLVRRLVNGGYNHYDKFFAAVQRGLERFTRGINATGAINMGASYGASDADAGGGQSRTVIAPGAGSGAQGQACVLAYALGLHARDRMNSHEFYAVLDCAADPRILDLEAQKTFEVKGISKDLDGVYTVDEVTFLPLTETVQAIVKAKRPDPKAAEARGFLFNANGLAPPASSATGSASNSTPGQPGSVTKINGEVKLGVPYKSQNDNAFNPGGACNATSLAMALEFLGVKHTGSGQFEDAIYEQLQASGVHPGTPGAMVDIIKKYGKIDNHNGVATDDEIRKHLDKGKPVVIHGDFTESGHILCVIGYNAKGFIVNDPYGKFLGSIGSYDNNASGAGNLHEYATVVNTFWHQNGTNSAHFIE